MSRLILLGPQRHCVTVGKAVKSLRINGPIATITAGWQEREAEVEELDTYLGQTSVNLLLHKRTEAIFREDPDLRESHRVHQQKLKRLQVLYRVRLQNAMDSVQKLLARRNDAAEELLDPEIEDAILAVRNLDHHHLRRIKEIRLEFEAHWRPTDRPALSRHYHDLAETLTQCSALVIAGGHVAVLLNRMRLFNLAPFLNDLPILAWSAGAMVLGAQVVLFHDDPPQGRGVAEVFESGLGLFDDMIPLPHAGKRLMLEDEARVSVFARRFKGSSCLTLDGGSRLERRGGRWRKGTKVMRLAEDGSTQLWEGS